MLRKLYSWPHCLVGLLVFVSLDGVTELTTGFSHRRSGTNGMKKRRY